MGTVTAPAPHSFCPACKALFHSAPDRCPVDGTLVERRADDPLCGFTLRGGYRLQRLVGSGATGRVYRARRLLDGAAVAVKILHGELAAEPRRAERFAREASRVARLRQPNIVKFLDAGHTRTGIPYLVMEYLEGSSLVEVVGRDGPLPARRAAGLLGDLCRALAYLHARDLVHRDLTSDNVIVISEAGEETAKLLDLGIALELDADPARRITGERLAVGTMSYMAPEQGLSKDVDHRADLFSLGVLLYLMLAGQPPFSGSPTEIALKNATAQVPPVRLRSPGTEPNPLLESIAHKLMAKSPANRFQSAEQILDALRYHLDRCQSAGREPWPHSLLR